MAKSVQMLEAKRLRKEGASIKEIAHKLRVSQGSVSSWCRDILLTKEQLESLAKRAKDPLYGGRRAYQEKIKKQTNKKIARLFEEGKKEVGRLNKRELFLVGIALYWSEGFKKDKQAGFANTDPQMINLYIKWLQECFQYKLSDLSPRVTLNISYQNKVKDIEKYWSQKTGIPLDSFQKPFFQITTWKKIYENPENYHGVLRIKVRKSLDFLRKIHGYIEGLKVSVN